MSTTSEKSPIFDGLADLKWPNGLIINTDSFNHIRNVPVERESLATEINSTSPLWSTKKKMETVYERHLGQASHAELSFDSRFESGNLEKTVKIDRFTYNLYLMEDVCLSSQRIKSTTPLIRQWFYFQVEGMELGETYTFIIANITRNIMMFTKGAKPLVYSVKQAEIKCIGWERIKTNIIYGKSVEQSKKKCLYKLSFNYSPQFEKDTVFFATCHPYTYSTLMNHIKSLKCNDPQIRLEKNNLCKTLSGNAVPILTITSGNLISENKQYILITGRIHPAETSASYVCESIINFLLSDDPDAKALLQRFIFKIIPMLNPDGVIVGNTRYSLSGDDLNRQYAKSNNRIYPTVMATKALAQKLASKRRLYLYCDVHGVNRNSGYYLIGCGTKANKIHVAEQMFIRALSSRSNKFSQSKGSYKISPKKLGTARAVISKMNVLSFTMEVTTGGSSEGYYNGSHFSTTDFIDIGCEFCRAILHFDNITANPQKVSTK